MNINLYFKVLTILFFSAFYLESFAQEKEEEKENLKKDAPYEDQFFKMRMNTLSDEHSADEYQFFNLGRNAHSKEYFPPYAGSQKSASIISNLLNVKYMGPYNIAARTRAFLIDKSNSNTLFSGGTTGGIWKSTDHGATWNAVNDQAENFNVTCIAQNPFNSSIIYYGTGEFIGNHTGVYGKGIFKSTDGGNTFSILPATNTLSFEYCMAIEHSLVDPNTVFTATNTAGLFRTTDGGNTFQQVFVQYNHITDVECFPDGRVWIAVSQIGIYQSLTGDSGTFTPLVNGLPTTGFSRIDMAFCDNFQLNAYIMYANTLGGLSSGILGIWKTTDGGVTWNATSNPDASYNFLYPKLNLCIAVKPDDPSFVVCGAGSLVYSSDGGANWFLVDNVHFDQHSIVFDPNNFSVVYNGSDGGVSRHAVSTMQTTYENLNTGYNTQQFFAGSYFPVGNSILAGAQDNNSQIGRNNDSIFIELNFGTINGCFAHVNQQDANVSFISSNNGEIFRSNNSLAASPFYFSVLGQLDGDGNGAVDDPTWSVNPFEINLNDGDQLYFVTQERVWRTTDGALNWQPLTNSIADAPYALGISNDILPTLYIGGENGLFMRVDNAYSSVPGNETDLSASLPSSISSDFISCLAVHPDNNSIVYAALSNYSSQPRIWKISDANTSTPVFTSISGTLPASLSVTWLEVDPMNPDSFFVAATDFGLYTSMDAGLTWSKELSLPNVSIPNIRLRKSDRKLFIFTHGRGAWMSDLPPAGTGICEPPNEDGIVVFPNPSYNKININLSKGLYLDEVVISDMAGRHVQKINYTPNNSLTKYMIDLSGKAKGVYFMNIKTNKCEVKKKLIKL